MRLSLFTLAAAAFSAVQAVKFTSQTSPGTTIDLSQGDIQVTWTDASTTQLTTAHLLLVNQAGGHTPFSYDFGEVQLASGKFTISKTNLPTGDAFQFELLATAQYNTGILALTQQFAITGAASGATLTLSGGTSGSATAAASTAAATSAAASTSPSTTTTSSTSTSTSTSTSVVTLTTSTSGSGSSSGSATTTTGTSTSTRTTSGGVATATTNAAVPKELGSSSLFALAIAAVFAMV